MKKARNGKVFWWLETDMIVVAVVEPIRRAHVVVGSDMKTVGDLIDKTPLTASAEETATVLASFRNIKVSGVLDVDNLQHAMTVVTIAGVEVMALAPLVPADPDDTDPN
jgi:hypothetical protein